MYNAFIFFSDKEEITQFETCSIALQVHYMSDTLGKTFVWTSLICIIQ